MARRLCLQETPNRFEQAKNNIENQHCKNGSDHRFDYKKQQVIDALTGPACRRRWSAEEKLTMVRESLGPGKSLSVLTRQHGVNPNQLFHWRELHQNRSLSADSADEEVVPASEYGMSSNKGGA
ncbi:hypothetical protein BZM26_35485 [Paraburkholderia strydomiana]|nr:hypothetical protein BZM26_35485 [Paraburkholderia strydomiana]